MARIQNSVVIGCSPDAVFDYLSDPRSELEWNPKVEVMETLTEGPLRKGSKFRAKWSKSKVVTMECTRYDRPRGWSYVNDGPVTVELTVDLVEDDAGTLLTSRFDARPRGAFRLVFPLFMAMMRREEARNMQLLKDAVESRSNPGTMHP